MKNLKNILLITSVGLLGLTQFSNSGYRTSITADSGLQQNDSTIQLLLGKINALENDLSAISSDIKKIKGLQEYIPTGTSISDLESITRNLNSRIDKLDRKDDDLEDRICSIKGTSFSTPSIESLERKIDKLERASHSH